MKISELCLKGISTTPGMRAELYKIFEYKANFFFENYAQKKSDFCKQNDKGDFSCNWLIIASWK